MRELILSIAKEGKTIIFASHILDEVEKICTHVGILKDGKLLTQGSMEAILQQKNYFQLKAKDNERLMQLVDKLADFNAIRIDEQGYLLVESTANESGETLNKQLAEQGLFLAELREYKRSLESIFIETVQA
jgi:ABC-2 type transport system ATP-binding protein